jgi:hypothetical protein
MRTQSRDTDPDAERMQLDLLRKMTAAERFQLVRSLTQTTRQLAWRAIQRANPDATAEEIALIFVAVHYGEDLANRLRAYLAARK